MGLDMRELTPADLEEVEAPRDSKPPGLVKRLTNRHHALAQALARGMAPADAGHATGYSPSRVSILQRDPAFRDLVRFYGQKIEAAFAGMHETLAGLSLDAAQVLRDRLEETPEEIGNRDLIDLVKTGADRTGHGPSSKEEKTVTLDLSDRLAAARARVANPVVMDAEVIEDG